MLLTYTFTYDTEKNEAALAGNIPIEQALQILQQLVIADAVNKAREAEKQPTEDKIKEGGESK